MTKEDYIEMTNLAFRYAKKYPDKDFTGAYDDYIKGFEAAYEIYNIELSERQERDNAKTNGDAALDIADVVRSFNLNKASIGDFLKCEKTRSKFITVGDMYKLIHVGRTENHTWFGEILDDRGKKKTIFNTVGYRLWSF